MVNIENIKQAEDKIRSLINDIEVMKNTEINPSEGQKIEDDSAEEIKLKLQEIAKLIAED